MGLFYSLLFGGSLPHFFYEIMEQILTSQRGLKQMLFFTTERLLYTPMFQAVSLYSLAILEVWRQSSTTKHPPHRSFLWINKIFSFCRFYFFGAVLAGQKSHRRRGQSVRAVLAHIEGELVVSVTVCVHQHQICAANGESCSTLESSHNFLQFNYIFLFCFVYFSGDQKCSYACWWAI